MRRKDRSGIGGTKTGKETVIPEGGGRLAVNFITVARRTLGPGRRDCNQERRKKKWGGKLNTKPNMRDIEVGCVSGIYFFGQCKGLLLKRGKFQKGDA